MNTMDEYRDYTIEISLKSPIVTPFRSDAIFGHICWAISFLRWEVADRLSEFLEKYDKEDFPPLLVSNAFPYGYLPKPILPPISQQELEGIIGIKNRIANSFKVKAIKSMDIIPQKDLEELQRDEITPLKLFDTIWKRYKDVINGNGSRELQPKLQPMVVQHNTVDRMSGKVTRGLYAQEEFFYDPNDEESGKYEIYLKTTNYFTLDDLYRIFGFISEQGYGRDKSTGKGYFTFEIKEGIGLPEPENPNAFMTLSSYIPTKNDPTTHGYYQILLNYGKLGGTYAKGDPEAGRNPFKKPLLMFSAGSTFYDNTYTRGKTYGSLLDHVHHNNKIRHYAYAFPIGIKLTSLQG